MAPEVQSDGGGGSGNAPAANPGEGQLQSVPIDSLGLQQLLEIRQQFEKEVQNTTNIRVALVQARVRYESCRKALTSLDNTEGKEMLVPLSDSLYVNGRQGDTDKILIDIGTNYFIEKTKSEAITYSQRKIDLLNKQINEIDKDMDSKSKISQTLDAVLRKRVAEQTPEPKK